jgi:hypothetical protein
MSGSPYPAIGVSVAIRGTISGGVAPIEQQVRNQIP